MLSTTLVTLISLSDGKEHAGKVLQHSHRGVSLLDLRLLMISLFFLSPVRVTSILKGHGEPFVLHILSQYFINAASAAYHLLQFWAATHQFRSPKYVHENEANALSV